jgi:superfamily II DNA/RNA helicase/cold shock CspA family protein
MSMSFLDLGVPEALVNRLVARGILEPFPIQAATIPDAMAGRDIVGKAATGSGKTLAFGLPLVAHVGKAAPRRPQGLILVPTRELAAQVQKEIGQLTADRGKRVLCIYGGTSYNIARKALALGVDIVVACPGRLEDMLEQRALDLSDITTVVVDEADRMADMGFLPAVRRIVSHTPDNRHVMLFSATMGPDVKSLVKEFTRDAAIHDVVGEEAPSDVDHFFWKVPREQRSSFTADIIDKYERAIVFTRTKHGADRLARQLEDRGISAVPIHGDRTQAQRERALKSVKNGQIQVLVATDVAARGIHIEALPCVVHFDPPAQATDYLHRSGRTGRAGATGVVISLVGEDTVGQVRRLQKALNIPNVIDSPADAVAVRLGSVDDAAAAERLDDRPMKSSGDRRPSRDRDDRGRSERPRFERSDRPERPRAERSDRSDRGDRPRFERSHSDRPASSDRPRFERRDDSRPASSDRPRFERRDDSRPASSDRPRFERRDDSRPAREERPRFDRRDDAPARSSRGGSSEAVVSFFNESKGYGFATDSKGQDLFIHFSNITMEGYKTLEAGQRVEYEMAEGPKGLEARNVRVVGGGRRRS